MVITAEIKGNRYNIEDLDNMLKDYLIIGENLYKLNKNKVEELFRIFIKKIFQ